MVIVNPTPRKTRRYKSTLTAVIVVSAVICIAWLIALSLISKSIGKDGSKTTTLRGQIQSVLVEQPKGTVNKQSAKYMLQSKLPTSSMVPHGRKTPPRHLFQRR
ncbi:hypothetical protein QTG54_005305 [Skeletonema marinoi]|uniref:Uncharacterized protein n=1 Tax=Skeletonema marinoi TaxID=267567 RepID=A0AAD8YCG8_9STRA|nr:hypothetical protein QTG54_005305 [Skeletonema marinoi]